MDLESDVAEPGMNSAVSFLARMVQAEWYRPGLRQSTFHRAQREFRASGNCPLAGWGPSPGLLAGGGDYAGGWLLGLEGLFSIRTLQGKHWGPECVRLTSQRKFSLGHRRQLFLLVGQFATVQVPVHVLLCHCHWAPPGLLHKCQACSLPGPLCWLFPCQQP